MIFFILLELKSMFPTSHDVTGIQVLAKAWLLQYTSKYCKYYKDTSRNERLREKE